MDWSHRALAVHFDPLRGRRGHEESAPELRWRDADCLLAYRIIKMVTCFGSARARALVLGAGLKPAPASCWRTVSKGLTCAFEKM